MKLVSRIVATLALPLLATTSMLAQSWSTQTNPISVGNISGRQVPSSVYFAGTTLAAYTSTNSAGGSYNDAYLYLTDNGGSGISFGNVRSISYRAANGSNVAIAGNNQPAIAYSPYDGKLYLSYRAGAGNVFVTSSSDGGSTWAIPTQLNVGAINYSPSLAVDSLGQHVYVGLVDSGTLRYELCTLYPGTTQAPTCVITSDTHQMNYGPSIALGNGVLFTAFGDRGNTHCLYFYRYNISTNGPISFWDPLSCGEQTSASPSLAINSGYLYVAFRSNDSSALFNYRVSSDGNTFGSKVTPGFAINGGPNMTFVQRNPGAGPSLGVVFTQNGSFASGIQLP